MAPPPASKSDLEARQKQTFADPESTRDLMILGQREAEMHIVPCHQAKERKGKYGDPSLPWEQGLGLLKNISVSWGRKLETS
jgi:hypothetical protein